MSLPTRRQVAIAFGSLLRTARNGAGLSQEEFAFRAAVWTARIPRF